MQKKKLLKSALRAINFSYSPYTKYSVGAALVTKKNKIFLGTNVENAGVQSICAERVAFCKAISSGYRDFKEIMIIGKEHDSCELQQIVPCGYCRQFMNEFCDKNFKIITYDEKNDKFIEYLLKDLLPNSFKF